MKILRLNLQNWGPFIGQQEIKFDSPDEAPVVLIHGENMRGKTSIMRAIRWSLYGNPNMTNELQAGNIGDFANWDARDSEVTFTFGATLLFEHASKSYEISRMAQATKAEGNGSKINVVLEAPLMKEIGGETIAMSQIDQRISAILDAKVADFFLFDGERLDQFEEMLKADESGKFMREQIELALGVPALLNLRDDVQYLLDAAGEQTKKHIKARSENKKLQEQLDENEDAIKGHETDIRELEKLHSELKTKIEISEDQLSKIIGIRDLVVARNGLEIAYPKLEEDRRGNQEELRSILEHAWWIPLAGILPTMLDQFELEQSATVQFISERATLQEQMRQIELQLGTHVCEMCGQDMPPEATNALQKKRDELQSSLSELLEPASIEEATQKVEVLRHYAGASSVLDQIVSKERSIRTIDLRLTQMKDEIQRFSERIGDPEFDVMSLEEGLRDFKSQQSAVSDTLAILKKAKEDAVQAKKAQLKKLAESTPAANRASAEMEVYERLLDYVNQSIATFRNSMREQVQVVASKIFQQLISESDYSSLRISGNYYLTIVDDKDREIRKRSAGASEIVTISLIGALGECSVEQAPIVMDTPFGRLDNTHRANILKWLSSRKTQSILFVQSGEFVRERDLMHLSNKVGREYSLRRVGSSSTTIEVLS